MVNEVIQFSCRFKFSDWPNPEVPQLAAGCYAIWHGDALIYCGMSGRQFESIRSGLKRYGLVTRLASHASGRLSGDQFCVYVANRLVIPNLQADEIIKFACGTHTLDRFTKNYIHRHFEYQYAIVDSSQMAYELEAKARSGMIFGVKPLLNPS